MTFGYDANVTRQDWDNSKNPILEVQSLWALFMYTGIQSKDDGEHRMDRPPQTLDREIGGRRHPVQGRDVHEHYQVISHYWGRQGVNNKRNAVITTVSICKDTSDNTQDAMLEDGYELSLEQVVEHDCPDRATTLIYCAMVGIPSYRRLRSVLESFLGPAVVLSCPTTVSAAALMWDCSLSGCQYGIFPLDPDSAYIES